MNRGVERSGHLDGAVTRIRSAGEGEEHAPPGIVLAIDGPRGRTAAIAGPRQCGGWLPAQPDDLAMTWGTAHDLASVTKVFTTVAIMRLVDAGLLSVDAPVRSLLPSASVAADTTLRLLLEHRAGLLEWTPLYVRARERSEAFAMLDALPLSYRPDAGRHYSDLGFMLLGRILESVTASSLPPCNGRSGARSARASRRPRTHIRSTRPTSPPPRWATGSRS